jgi:two-component system response regulator RegA
MTELPETATARPLLLVDDDATFVRVLARARLRAASK